MTFINKFTILLTSFLISTGFYLYGAITPTKIAFVIFIGMLLLNAFVIRKPIFRVSQLDLVTIIVFVLAIVSQGWSLRPSESMPILLSYAYYVIFYFVVRLFYLNRPQLIDFAVSSLVIVAVVSSLLGIVQFLTGAGYMPGTPVRSLTTGGVNRACGMFTDPNYFGLVLLVVWPLALTINQRVLRYSALGVMGIALLFTLSRATYLIVVLQLVGMVFVYSRHYLYFIFKLFIMGGAFALVAVFALPDFIVNRVDTLMPLLRGDIGALENSASERIHLIFAGIRMFLDHPITGVGFGNFQLYSESYMPLFAREVFAHNTYITIAAELGLFGFSVWMIGLMFILYRAYRTSSPFFVGMIGLYASYFFLVANYFHFLGYYFALFVSFSQMFDGLLRHNYLKKGL